MEAAKVGQSVLVLEVTMEFIVRVVSLEAVTGKKDRGHSLGI